MSLKDEIEKARQQGEPSKKTTGQRGLDNIERRREEETGRMKAEEIHRQVQMQRLETEEQIQPLLDRSGLIRILSEFENSPSIEIIEDSTPIVHGLRAEGWENCGFRQFYIGERRISAFGGDVLEETSSIHGEFNDSGQYYYEESTGRYYQSEKVKQVDLFGAHVSVQYTPRPVYGDARLGIRTTLSGMDIFSPGKCLRNRFDDETGYVGLREEIIEAVAAGMNNENPIKILERQILSERKDLGRKFLGLYIK